MSDKERKLYLDYLLKENTFVPIMVYRIVLFGIGIWLGFTPIFAQEATLKGVVVQEDSREAMPFASVQLEGTRYGTSTDQNGFFSITKLQPDTYQVAVSALGYETFRMAYVIAPGEVKQLNIRLKTSAREIGVYDFEGDRIQEKRENTNVSTVSITPEQMSRMPSYGGESDVAQIMQVIPGVTTTGDQGGQLFIRGGPPIQNKVLLDGAVIYNPFHSIGFFSVFDTDLLNNFEVYAGGFGANHGGRISSIMDISTRDGKRTRISGKANLNTFTGKLMLEGPLAPKKDGAAPVTFMLSAKGSFLEQSADVFYPYADSTGLPFNFFDGYAKITAYTGTNGSKVNFFGFSHNDWVNFNQTSDLNWRSGGGGANFFLIPGAANVNIDGVFSYSNYIISLEETAAPPRSSEINGFNFNVNFHQYYGLNKLSYGIEANGFSTDFRFENGQGREIAQTENTTEFAGYMRYKFLLKRFVFDPSLRLHYYASLNEVSIEPRLAVKMNITEHFRIKAAGGLYSQNLIAANSDRDVVNLFYGFLSGNNNLPKEFRDEEINSSLQKAQHAILGAEFELFKFLEFNVEGYYMHFNQLININRNKIYDDTPANSAIPDYQKKDFIRETGWSAGIDVLLKAEYKRWYLWLGYSLMAIGRSDEIQDYTPHFDRRHNVNLVASYQFGKNKAWEVNARWNMGTGFPFTQTQGFYEFLGFQNGITTDYTSQNGELGVELGDLNTGRLPAYHRLDMNIKRRFQFGKYTKLEINAGATNVYNRNNIFYIDRITFERVDQLPIIPTVGLNLSF